MSAGLIHYWRRHLAVLAATAVAAAVLTGALLVGDSVRGSLGDLTMERLGHIDYSLVSERFFRQQLVADLLAAGDGWVEAVVGGILLPGTAATPQGVRANRVQISGVEGNFAGFFPLGGPALQAALDSSAGTFAPVVINEALQRQLGVVVGDFVLLSFAQHSAIHRESLFGRRDSEAVLRTRRCQVVAILPDRGVGRFALRPHQSLPLNAFVPLEVLQQTLEQPQKINAIYLRQTPTEAVADSILAGLLETVVTLEDLGLSLRLEDGYMVVESGEFVLPEPVLAGVLQAAATSAVAAQPVLTYLANRLGIGSGAIAYSTVVAADMPAPPLGALTLVDGRPAPPLQAGEILLNSWAAADLSAEVGDQVELEYFEVASGERLVERRVQFELVGIVALEGLALAKGLAPAFPGIENADDMAAWEAPFPLDLKRIRPEDEAYWDEYGATPKAFVSSHSGQQLWRSRFGQATAVWVSGEKVDAFARQLLMTLRPEAGGLVFFAVKAAGLAAAVGATDFGGLFIGFSMFLIAAAALLAGLLYRFGIEQRASELGLLAALGYPLKAVRRRFLAEGLLLAAFGALLGLGGAVLYARALMLGLRTWWRAAVGTSHLVLHVEPQSLALGLVLTLAIVGGTIWWTMRRLSALPARALLTGAVALPPGVGRRRSGWVGAVSLAAALGLLAAALAAPQAAAGLFFGMGALLLVAGLALLAWLLGRPTGAAFLRGGLWAWLGLGVQNSARRPGRSLLSAALVACASFVLVAVGANRGGALNESGTGAYGLVAETEVPLYGDLSRSEDRFALGLPGADSLFEGTQIAAFRLLPGEDISCLNLYRPGQPRLLGVPATFVERGGFEFGALLEAAENPWTLLDVKLADGVIPAIGDFNSVQWILHAGLGDEITVNDAGGRPLRLKLVGLLKNSLFQSELLISEAQFKAHFPERAGYSYFLIDAPAVGLQPLGVALEAGLGPYGLDVMSTGDRLASFRMVEQTYLSTFQVLGGLGLVLGTVGLGLVLLRNVLERQGELATLQACGFRRRVLGILLLAESGAMLVAGLLIGTLAALAAAAPHLLEGAQELPWAGLVTTLVTVLLVGLAACAGAVFYALGLPLLPALKAGR